MALRRWPVLRRRPFVVVMSGELVSMIGDSLYTVALAWLVLTQSTPQVLALTLIFLGVPRGLLVLVGGAWTDRFSARLVMFCSHLARAVLVCVLTLVASAGALRPWHFFVVAAAFGIGDAFFWPASKTILPALVPRQELVQANAVNSMAEQATMLVGPALGGLVVALWGPVPALAINAATFAVAAMTVWAAPRAAAAGEPAARVTFRGTLLEIKEGLAYAGGKAGVRVVLIIVSASTLAYSGLFGVGLPALATTFPQASLALGLMVSAWGLGQFAGAATAGVTGLPRRWGLLIIGMAFAEGTTFAVIGLIPDLWVIIPLLTVLGFGVAYSSDVALPAWIQTTTPEHMLGRVNSVMEIPYTVFEPISMIAIATLASVDVRLALAGAAVPMLTAGVVLAASRSARSLGIAAATAAPVQKNAFGQARAPAGSGG
jgi:Transmembrane secretion effector